LIHVAFTARIEMCPPVHINSVQLPQEDVQYLGLHLDRRLTWHKWKQLGMTLTRMCWQQTILKPIWAYGILLRRMASTSYIEILERFQSNALRMTVDAPRYVPNTVIRRDLHTPTVKEEIDATASILCSPQHTPKRASSEPHGATRQQAIAETPAK
jgi:hypothetical protein